MKLLIGDSFPTLNVKTTQGNIRLPQAYKGKWLVFFSRPGDFTPVCTTEFVGFQKRLEKFETLNTKLLGLSVDSLSDHHSWVTWIKDNLRVEIQFPIIDDKNRKVSLELGMIREAQADTSTARTVIIVDKNGVVRTILEYPKELGRNMDEIVRIVEGLQISDANGVFPPANWPHNEIIGDKVLLPPKLEISDEQAKQEGITKLVSWFKYKNL